MTSLENIFKGLGNSIKQNIVSRGITVSESAGFTTIMSKLFDVIDLKADIEDVPTKTSDLTNDSGFITSSYHDNSKVDKETGKGLSTNDYTSTEKTKLAGLENYDDTEIKGDIASLESDKQDKLVSGTNIKTINNNSLLGTGNLEVITDISGKQDVLVDTGTGANIKKINNTSILGSGNITVQAPLTEGSDYLNKTHLDSNYQAKGNYAHLVDGVVPSSELPSYVDDVIEGYYYNGKFYQESSHTTEIPAETGKIYIDITTPNSPKTYRYSGTAYVVITSGDVTVVDVVQDGNLNAVSSNAVYDEIYSTVIGTGFEAYMTG